MLKKISGAFRLALFNIRARFFHTLLSVLGIVIGVASLVSILSLIDGMEQFANEQIAQTTSLNTIIIRSDAYKWVNNLRVRKDSVAVIDYAHYKKLGHELTLPTSTFLRQTFSIEVTLRDPLKVVGASVIYSSSELYPEAAAVPGNLFTDQDLESKVPVALVNRAFMRSSELGVDSLNLIGKTLAVRGVDYKIIGILKGNRTKNAEVYLPFSFVTADLVMNPPELIIEAKSVADVTPLKEQSRAWLKTAFPGRDDFALITNEFRVEQAAKGFLIFRVVMGLIVGISVMVGGIGVMNVLLISVNERTVEIGIRKAVGANKRDILFQFLSESITISAFGSLLGLVVGILGTMVIIPIVKAITEAPFQAAYTVNTLIIISVVALLVGVVFGTYPAMRAARLDPVEAIRRE